MGTISTKGLKAKNKSFYCLGATGVAKAATDTNNCALSHYYSYEFKQEADPSFDSEQWRNDHDKVLSKTIPQIKKRLPNTKFLEPESQFLKMRIENKTVFGVPDIVGIKENKIFIIDAKSGKKRKEHSYQVSLYALMGIANKLATEIGGIFLSYPSKGNDSEKVELIDLGDQEAVDKLWTKEKRTKVKSLMKKMGEGHEPDANPSISNCMYCSWKNRCSLAVKKEEKELIDIF